MPSTSDKQAAAMRAAASGHSSLGIPQKVGREFVAADSLEAMTGLKKTHRGKRSRGKGPKMAADHHKDLSKHMASGDHDSAKKAALMLAKALHKQQSLTPKPEALL